PEHKTCRLFFRLGIFIFLSAFGVSSISAACDDYPCTTDSDCPSGCRCDEVAGYPKPGDTVYKWLGVVSPFAKIHEGCPN
ncbi:hypothetical protein BGY98DRAFT_954450, partial [Russula aff. rugulosa BPL654]